MAIHKFFTYEINGTDFFVNEYSDEFLLEKYRITKPEDYAHWQTADGDGIWATDYMGKVVTKKEDTLLSSIGLGSPKKVKKLIKAKSFTNKKVMAYKKRKKSGRKILSKSDFSKLSLSGKKKISSLAKRKSKKTYRKRKY